jgi:hypothetical protein
MHTATQAHAEHPATGRSRGAALVALLPTVRGRLCRRTDAQMQHFRITSDDRRRDYSVALSIA